MQLGDKIRTLRERRGMKLKDLAARSQVQMATLSRIENNKMIGSIESHMRIADALGIDLPTLYDGITLQPTEGSSPLPPSPAEKFEYNEKAAYEILTTRLFTKRMLPMVLRLEPDASTEWEQYKIGVEKFVYVLENSVVVELNKDRYDLKKHQALYFEASLKHRFINETNHRSKILLVVSPVVV